MGQQVCSPGACWGVLEARNFRDNMDNPFSMNRKSGPEIDQALDIGDPFEFFVKQAYTLYRELSIPLDFAHEAIAIIKMAFGEEWLREKVRTKTRATALPLRTHPLGNYLAVSGPRDIVDILELAVYIRRLWNVPRLMDVLNSMKEDYGPGYMQLAYAYRLVRAGASNIQLEPEAEGGRKADIYFELSGVPYLVECYIPQVEHEDSSQELQYSVEPIFRAIRSTGDRTERVVTTAFPSAARKLPPQSIQPGYSSWRDYGRRAETLLTVGWQHSSGV